IVAPRLLEARDAVANGCGDRLGIERCARARHQDRDHAFAEVGVRRTDDGALEYPGLFVEQQLDFLRVDVEARSEEHTSELQSLMHISYAVFCLKKKQTK